MIFLDCIIKARGTLVSCGKDKKKKFVLMFAIELKDWKFNDWNSRGKLAKWLNI